MPVCFDVDRFGPHFETLNFPPTFWTTNRCVPPNKYIMSHDSIFFLWFRTSKQHYNFRISINNQILDSIKKEQNHKNVANISRLHQRHWLSALLLKHTTYCILDVECIDALSTRLENIQNGIDEKLEIKPFVKRLRGKSSP